MVPNRLTKARITRDRLVLDALALLCRVVPFYGSNETLAEKAGYSRATIARALKSLEQRKRILRIVRRTKHRGMNLNYRRVFLVSPRTNEEGALTLIGWVREQGLPMPYRYGNEDEMCGRFACTPHQLRSWLRHGREARLLRYTKKFVPDEPAEEDDDEDGWRGPKTWGRNEYSVSVTNQSVRGMDPPPPIGSLVMRDGVLRNEVEFLPPRQSIKTRLLALIKKEVELFGACSLTDAALANGIKAARSATQEALARLIDDGEVFKQGGRRRVLSLAPIADELLLKYRAKASGRCFKFDRAALLKSQSKLKSARKGGRPRKNPIKFTVPEVQRAIVSSFDLLDHPGKLPNEIAITRDGIEGRVLVVLARQGHQLSRLRVLEELAHAYALEQVGYRGRPIIPEFKFTSGVFQDCTPGDSDVIDGNRNEAAVLAPAMADTQQPAPEGWTPPTLSLNFEDPYARVYERLRREKDRAPSQSVPAPTPPRPSSEPPSKSGPIDSPKAFRWPFLGRPSSTGQTVSYDEDAEKPLTKQERRMLEDLWTEPPGFTRTPQVKRTPEQEKARQEYLAIFRRFGSRGSSGT